MNQIVADFAEALLQIDRSRQPFRDFRPGVGPYGEPQVLKRAVTYLHGRYPGRYGAAVTKRDPDVLIPGRWGLEFKIVRPFGDNGELAEHWSQNLLHPYEGNVSALGDAIKLTKTEGPERKGIVVFTYEHNPPRIDLEVLVRSFELIARDVLQLPLGPRQSAELANLVHPVHQRGSVLGWEILHNT